MPLIIIHDPIIEFRGHFQTITCHCNVREEGGHDANFSLNFEPSLALIWIVYLPLSSSPGIKDCKRGEGGVKI
jgi:hypothetical protein